MSPGGETINIYLLNENLIHVLFGARSLVCLDAGLYPPHILPHNWVIQYITHKLQSGRIQYIDAFELITKTEDSRKWSGRSKYYWGRLQ